MPEEQTLVVPPFGRAFPYCTEIEPVIANHRARFDDLAQGIAWDGARYGLPNGEFVTLYLLGRADALGEDLDRYPAAAVAAGKAIYALVHNAQGPGNVPADIALFGEGRPGRGTVVPKGYVPVLWRTHPGPDGEPTEHSREDTVLLAPPGFSVPTDSGELYDRFSGTALATVPGRDTAISLLMKRLDWSREFAEKEVSFAGRSDKTKGKRYVARWHSDAGGGPLRMYVGYEPGLADPVFGALPARRPRAERAELALTAADAGRLREAAAILNDIVDRA